MENEIEVISKVEAAIAQLCDAIELYYKERYISAITLAGAAEEIFSRLGSELFGGKTRHDSADITASMIALTLHNVDFKGLSYKKREQHYSEIKGKYLSEHDRVRNELKHKSNPNENYAVAESFERVAHNHISDAISNIIISRTQLIAEEPLITKYCNDFGLTNPFKLR